jgi:predicted tellurium resistance membrane protein TerC
MDVLLTPAGLISLGTLFALELVLGIDNIIFISILAGKLPKDQQNRARMTGLSLAVITRIILLFSLSWLVSLTEPWFHVFEKGISGRDLILILGGLFLLAKSTHEIHGRIAGETHEDVVSGPSSFSNVIMQILVLDIVFSFDSVITAVGMVDHLIIMVVAVIAAAAVMVLAARSVSDFVERNPTIKMLALSFLLLIGCTLVADGLGHHVPKGYIYFSMAFSLFVEMLNMRFRKKITPKTHASARP